MADKITIRVPFSQSIRALGRIGRVGENVSRRILFDCASALAGRASATITCVIQRSSYDDPYLAPIEETDESGVYSLTLRDVDVAIADTVKIELRMLDGDEILKTAIYTGIVEPSITADPVDPGNPVADMLDKLETAADTANEAVKQIDVAVEKAESAVAEATTAVSNANEAIASANAATETAETAANQATTAASNAQSVADTVQAKLDAGEFKGEKGDTGATGATGADGISPTVSTSKADGVTTVTITDRDGTHTATINDGAKGEKGDKGDAGAQGEKGDKGDTGDTGATGADGYSPTATVSKSGTTTTVTVTDKNGTTTAEVLDGSDASVTKENVVSALGYTPEAQPDTWTLIETITLTEATKTVSRTAKPDGTAYKLKRLHIIVESPSGVSTKIGGEYYLYCKDGTAVYCWEDNLIQTAEGRQAILLAEINRDALTVCNEWRVGQSLWNTYTLKWTYGIITEGTWMHSISINGASNLPTGTKITIYGVDKED